MSATELTASQRTTYQSLTLGFNQDDSCTVAINHLLTGDIQPAVHQLPQQPKPPKEEYIPFKITHFSRTLMSGYIRTEEHLKYDIPDDIQTEIIKYFNFFFVRLHPYCSTF
eukprot:801658_1